MRFVMTSIKLTKVVFLVKGKITYLPALLGSPLYLRGPWVGPSSLADAAVFPGGWRSAP
jgi:hypothetical protein